MDKKILRFMTLMFVVTFSICLTACGDEDDDEPSIPTKTLNERLVGNWTEIKLDAGEPPYLLSFRSNQSGTISYVISDDSRASVTITVSQEFKWNAVENPSATDYIQILTTSGDPILEDGKYTLTLIDDELRFSGLRFRRN